MLLVERTHHCLLVDSHEFAISHRDEFPLLPMETAKFGNAITESLECLAELPADYRSRP